MEINELLKNWNIAFATGRPDLCPAGSPNRSVQRSVAADTAGQLYIVEGFEMRKKARQTLQYDFLVWLKKHGLTGIEPYLSTGEGTCGVVADGCFWQVRKWLEATPLPRRELGNNENFAVLCGDFLLDLKQIWAAESLPRLPNERFFLSDYAPRLRYLIHNKMPQISSALTMILDKLSPFWDIERNLPPMLAHGDFHPGNMLVKNGRLAAVIDWEFTGLKCPGYDLALLLGCLGMDDPEWLNGNLTITLQNRLYQADYMPDAAWQHLTELMAAIRLGWLGEWVDMNEVPLARQEISYINMLLAEI